MMKAIILSVGIIYVYFNGYWEEQIIGAAQAIWTCDLLVWANKKGANLW